MVAKGIESELPPTTSALAHTQQIADVWAQRNKLSFLQVVGAMEEVRQKIEAMPAVPVGTASWFSWIISVDIES